MTDQPAAPIPLDFGDPPPAAAPKDQLSACCLVPPGDPTGRLWVAGDEDTALWHLSPDGALGFRDPVRFDLSPHLALPKGPRKEIDIEGLDCEGGRLWLVGSHSLGREKPDPEAEGRRRMEPLALVKPRPNRLVLACLDLADGLPGEPPRVAALPIAEEGNALTRALAKDPHLGPFLRGPASPKGRPRLALAAKENGLDIEGLAVRGDRLLLGLRGPVLREWALLLELGVEQDGPGVLALRPIGRDGRHYRKHFVDLGGMGTRDLVFQGNDLLILAGPTMDIAGLQGIFRLHDVLGLEDDSATAPGERLTPLLRLPFNPDGDKAEGLALCDGPDGPGLMVLYDSPVAARVQGKGVVLADRFLPG